MKNYIDGLLSQITMYRLVLYFLIVLILVSMILGYFGLIPFGPIPILFSTLALVVVTWITNLIFSSVFNAPANIESVYITALILVLIVSPMKTFNDFLFLMMAGILAMASKYILTIRKKHIFNPAAIAVVLTSLVANQSASWWVGNLPMMFFVVIGGLLIVRKIQRENTVFSFFVSAFLTITLFSLFKGVNLFGIMNEVIFHSSLFFFAFVMLTEPLTSPPTKDLQNLYGLLVGFLFAPELHFGSFYLTPELALVAGNIFSYIVSPKEKLILNLGEKLAIAPNTFDFIFPLAKRLAFTPGQYMEWTLPHDGVDDRGNRRYFTLASSPTEDDVRLGVKFSEAGGSSYKRAMLAMDGKTPMVASQRAGDFTLPKNPHEKLVFIAGGIGITPFRSILKYLIDTHQMRNIVLLYSNKYKSEIVYEDVLNQAEVRLNTKVVYTITDRESVPQNWHGKVGRIDEKTIREEIPDYQERLFYLSGPHGMVAAFQETLKNMGVKGNRIKIDFFPGYA